jgi:hypothetical protein
MTRGLTVAICGRLFGQRIVAMMLPPKAGLIWRKLRVSSSMSSDVQSAVSPVLRRAATRGMNDLPIGVAPARIISGLCFFIKDVIMLA